MKSILFCLLLIASRAPAIVDEDGSGMSRIWQEQWNHGEKYSPSLDPLADDDGDSMSNYRESLAGTDPKSGLPPLGVTQVTITYTKAVYQNSASGQPTLLTPETASITWLGFVGKSYQLEVSADLSTGSWSNVGEPITGDGTIIGQAVTLTQPDGSIPPKLFFRVRIGDLDEDFDGLSNAEEYLLGTNPHSQWSDSDYLSDYDEVTVYHTNPMSADSDGNGILDHDEAGIVGDPSASFGVYEPDYEWIILSRGIGYTYRESEYDPSATPEGEMSTWCSWRGWEGWLGTNDENSLRFTIPELLELLDWETKFPDPGFLPQPSPFGIPFNETSFSVTTAHGEGYSLHQFKFWLRATQAPTKPVKKSLMLILHQIPKEGPEILSGVTSIQCTISSGAVSSAEILGKEGAVGIRRQLASVEFEAPEGPVMEGWDTTEGQICRSVPVGETVDGAFNVKIGNLPPEVIPLLEVAATDAGGPGGASRWLQVSGAAITATRGTFKITASAMTGKEGAEIAVRLKDDKAVVFARMNVCAFKALPKAVPVSIFRIYDSRIPATSLTPTSLSDADIIKELNDTYQKQINVTFVSDPTSGTYDLRRLPKQTEDNPTLFNADGSLTNETQALAINELTRTIHNLRSDRISIHILEKYYYRNDAGTTWTDVKASFVKIDSTGLVYSHEIGHSLGLASKKVGADLRHDLGPWPSVWRESALTGLMYQELHKGMNRWLRREDWYTAYKIAQTTK